MLYAGPPGTSRWHDVAGPAEQVGARAVVYLRRRDGVGGRSDLARSSRTTWSPRSSPPGAKELRTQTFLPWNQKTWDTPDVAHDNPADQRFHASLVLGFADPAARTAFFDDADVQKLSPDARPVASAIHAYDVSAALTSSRRRDPPAR